MIFQELGFDKFTIRINNRKVLNGLFAELNITENSKNVMQIIDRLEKVGTIVAQKELQELTLSSREIEKILNFTQLKGTCDKIITELQNFGINNIQFNEGIEELKKVVSLIKQLGVPTSNFSIDLTIARGLDYYTGTVYETQLDDYPEIGSVKDFVTGKQEKLTEKELLNKIKNKKGGK